MWALLSAVFTTTMAQDVTFDFSENAWGLPENSGNKATQAQQFSSNGYTITLEAPEGGGYYYHTQGKYVLLGKKDATLTLPAFNFDVEKIAVTGTSGASAAVLQNIFVGDNPVSTETKGAKNVTHEYAIAPEYQAAGNIYVLKVTSAHNTQFTKVEIFGKGGTVKVKPTISGTTPFTESTTVTITAADPKSTIFYTTDGSHPATSGSAEEYEGPFVLTETTTVKAIEESLTGEVSDVAEMTFVKQGMPSLPSAANIAAYKALEQGTNAILQLNNAQVVYANGRDVFVRDASGAIEFFNTGLTFETGQMLNGYVAGEYKVYSGLPELCKSNDTNADGYTVTAGTATPKNITIAQAMTEEILCDLVKIAGVKIELRGSDYYAIADGQELRIYNKFKIELGDINPDETYTIEGIAANYNGAYQLYVTQPIASGSTPQPDVTVCNNIAALKALENNTKAELKLNNTQVLYANSRDVFVRDASGAVEFYNTGITFETGQVLNGSIFGDFKIYNGIPELCQNDMTNADGFTAANGTAVPKVLTIAQAKSDAYLCDLVKFENVKVEVRDNSYYAIAGNEEILVYNKFKIELGEVDPNADYTVEGIVAIYNGAYQLYVTQPITSGTTPDPGITTCANIAAFKALENKTAGKLLLNNAEVVYANGRDVFVRDASGAIEFFNTGLTFETGQVLNGNIIGEYTIYNGLPELCKNDQTNADGYTVSTTTIVPKSVTIAQMKNDSYLCDLVKIENVKIEVRESDYYAIAGDEELRIFNKFKIELGEVDPNATYTVEGIAAIYNGAYQLYATQPITTGTTPQPQFPVCENIAAFKALDKNTEAELTLSDAKVLYANGRDVFVSDASGAIEFYNTGIEFVTGQVLNGSIIGKFSPFQNLPELAKTDNTNTDKLTITDGDAATPKQVTIAQLLGETYLCDLVQLSNVSVATEGDNLMVSDGTDKLQLYDKFKVAEGTNWDGLYVITGILSVYKENYQLYPLTVSVVDGIRTAITHIDPTAPAYNLAGQRVDAQYKGVVIQGGKKLIRK